MRDSSHADSTDHAGVWVPPPLLYVAVFLLAAVLQGVLPLPGIPGLTGRIAGLFFLAVGAALILWSVGLFRRTRTSVIPVRPTTVLVIDGPYRFTRNPMYLGLLSVYLGGALVQQLLWAVLLLPMVIVMVQQLVIRKEEQYLARKFGHEYARYKTQVRRWL